MKVLTIQLINCTQGHSSTPHYFRNLEPEETVATACFRNYTQWAFGAKMTSYRRRCDVITSFLRHLPDGYDYFIQIQRRLKNKICNKVPKRYVNRTVLK